MMSKRDFYISLWPLLIWPELPPVSEADIFHTYVEINKGFSPMIGAPRPASVVVTSRKKLKQGSLSEAIEMKNKSSGIGRRRAAAKAYQAPKYEKRREEIYEAAARVFNRKGFSGTTVSAVAKELSIDRASLYYYISSKEQLFDELIREVSDANVAMAQAIAASKELPSAKLRQLIVELMESYARNYPILYIYIREDLDEIKDTRSEWANYMRRVNREYEGAVIDIIQEGYKTGCFQDVGNAKVVAYGIIGMVGWTNRWFKPKKADISASKIGRIYADMVIGGLA